MDQLQSRIWLTAFSYMGKYLGISSYIRKPFLIYVWLCNCSTLNFLIFFIISVVQDDKTWSFWFLLDADLQKSSEKVRGKTSTVNCVPGYRDRERPEKWPGLQFCLTASKQFPARDAQLDWDKLRLEESMLRDWSEQESFRGKRHQRKHATEKATEYWLCLKKTQNRVIA